ncbi:hypothetical protein NE865_11234 [Phthorimaea operculella]|nr:hypothetical protein NE865_11234 [Phthorimaea operculella]
MQLATLQAPLPADGMVLGGTMELQGANVSLACFHGNSFKAKSWALFSLKQPVISFATEAQQLADQAGECSAGNSFKAKSWALFSLKQPVISFATEAQQLADQAGECSAGNSFKAKSWALFSLKQPVISFATEAQQLADQAGECSAGNSFKAKSWALFSLKQPVISFATEAQQLADQAGECSAGNSFKAKSWALFSLKQPVISFATEAQQLADQAGECSAGNSFKAKSWALFSLKQPVISFATEAQQLADQAGNSFKAKSWALFSLKQPVISFATEAQQLADQAGECSAGNSFKAKSWALFSLKQPVISFATEAQQLADQAGECSAGNSFKAKSWALFSLKQPVISFATEAQQLADQAGECSAGNSFKAKSWALFSLKQPVISFATEAQQLADQAGECSAGNSFKAKSWALFSLKQPVISFATEAQQLADQAGECSAGNSFKAKSWALFSLKQPVISFATEAQQLADQAGECSAGNSFKAKSWALFSLKQPVISFATEAQQLADQAGECSAGTASRPSPGRCSASSSPSSPSPPRRSSSPTRPPVISFATEAQQLADQAGECSAGNSFKAKSWALFSLKQPVISFATEAQQLADQAGDLEVHVVQSLTAGLGLSAVSGAASSAGHQSMATVCRMTRALLFPPQFKTLSEWFHYAFHNSEIDAIELFPSLERENNSTDPGAAPPTASTERRPPAREAGGAGKGGEHTREVIFALPSLQLHLRTQHRQAPTPPTEQDPKPVVECSFITEFEDHIFVSVDAEAFLFLHDLISSYIKEKDRVGKLFSFMSTLNSFRLVIPFPLLPVFTGLAQSILRFECSFITEFEDHIFEAFLFLHDLISSYIKEKDRVVSTTFFFVLIFTGLAQSILHFGCSFITEFEDHIFVSVDAEAFLFLHDLISSYIKEKDRVFECSFITEFEDHIFVSLDAEAFLFLHDLISSYIKEKDRVFECSFITELEDHIFVSVDAEAFLFLHDLISSYIKEKDRVFECSFITEFEDHIFVSVDAEAFSSYIKEKDCVHSLLHFECSFITEFEDHIFVSVDAEAFLFLHDLISSYIKEKDRVCKTKVMDEISLLQICESNFSESDIEVAREIVCKAAGLDYLKTADLEEIKEKLGQTSTIPNKEKKGEENFTKSSNTRKAGRLQKRPKEKVTDAGSRDPAAADGDASAAGPTVPPPPPVAPRGGSRPVRDAQQLPTPQSASPVTNSKDSSHAQQTKRATSSPIHPDFSAHGISAVDISAGTLKGRPYGGVAVLWRKTLFTNVNIIETGSTRVAAVCINVSSERSFIVMSVYMPTEDVNDLPLLTDNLASDSIRRLSKIIAFVHRLLSWAGKSIEPYGVDYILQKLGFRHARTTIPKWLQRGALDPLDRSLAALLARLAAIVPRRQL